MNNFYPVSDSCQLQGIDLIFERHFGRKAKGSFVEVGAHDGYSFSNTWGLAKIGWKGLYFEPMEDLAKQCAATHAQHDVKVIQKAVGDVNGPVKLWVNGNPTIDQETVDKSPWGEKYDPEKFIMVPCITLNESLADEGWKPEFDLLVIDVEGAELQVLEGFDVLYWYPQMIIVETHEGNSDSRKSFHAEAINFFMNAYPYVKVHVDGLNTIWVRK